jgi:hypothetical protein
LGVFLIALVLIAQVSCRICTKVVWLLSLTYDNFSSTLPLSLPLVSTASVPPRVSSSPTSPFLLCSSSGPAATCGSALDGFAFPRSTLTLDVVSLTGRRSTPTAQRLPPGLPGDVSLTSSSRRLGCRAQVTLRHWKGIGSELDMRCTFSGCPSATHWKRRCSIIFRSLSLTLITDTT